MEDGGLVARRDLPPPAARTVYELTDEGRSLETVLRALGRWGIGRLGPPAATDVVTPGSAVRSGLMMYARTGCPDRVYAVVVDDQPFTVRVSDRAVEMRAGAPDDPDLTLVVTARDLVAARFAARPRRDRPTGWGFTPASPSLVKEFLGTFGVHDRSAVGRQADLRRASRRSRTHAVRQRPQSP
jgi:HxlR-like helix-turn-helix